MPDVSGTARNDAFMQWKAPFIGKTQGNGVPFPGQWNSDGIPGGTLRPPAGVEDPDTAGDLSSGVFAAGTKTGAASAEVSLTGSASLDGIGYNAHWFEIVHIFPRPYLSKLDFGIILTQADLDYEIYNAFRDTSVTENAIVNGATPGISLPDNAPSVVLQAQSSLLDSSSTGNSGGVGLGTLVRAKVRALTDGLPAFDTMITFQFISPASDVFLLLEGSRIVFFPLEYEGGERGPVERLEFATDVHAALSGKEKRPALRKNPRQYFDVTYSLDGADRQRLRAFLFDWLDNQFGFPVWHEYLRLTSAVTAGATQYQVVGADDLDFRVGGLAVVISDADTFDVLNLTAKTDTLLTASNPSVNAYARDTLIMPVRIAYIKDRVQVARQLTKVEDFRVTWEVVDNDTGVPAESATPGFWSTYGGRVLFDDCNVVTAGSSPGTITLKSFRMDNRTGRVHVASSQDRSKDAKVKGFHCRSRAEIMQLRQLWYALRGQQKAFYMPTLAEDLTVSAELTIGLDTMDIVNIGYTKYAKDRLPWTIFRITYTNGSSEVKIVSSSAIVSATVERLTLTTTWAATHAVSEVSRVEFYELSRFESDTLRLRYPRVAQAEAKVPVVRVFDDNA